MNIYHLDCSVNESKESLTRKYSQFIVDRLKIKKPSAKVYHFDLMKENIPFIDKAYEKAMFTPENFRTDEDNKALDSFNIKPFMDADVYVLGVPGYLFSVPARFKNWLEHLFRFDSTLTPEWVGKLEGKRMLIVSAWGGIYTNTEIEHSFETILRKAFGLFGIANISFFNIYHDKETDTDNIKNVEQAIVDYV